MHSHRPVPLRRQQGFTLVELIMVIVIVGILSAVALPRFYDMSSSARAASAQSLYSAVNSAMAITHSAALVKGIAASATDSSSVTMDGSSTALSMVYGYPAATAAGIGAALNSSFAAPTYATGSPATATWTVGSCTVVYTAATGATAAASVTAPGASC